MAARLAVTLLLYFKYVELHSHSYRISSESQIIHYSLLVYYHHFYKYSQSEQLKTLLTKAKNKPASSNSLVFDLAIKPSLFLSWDERAKHLAVTLQENLQLWETLLSIAEIADVHLIFHLLAENCPHTQKMVFPTC